MAHPAPLFWIKRVEESLRDAKIIPLHGSLPIFDWDKCSKHIGEMLQLPSITIAAHKVQWLKKEELLAGFGMNEITIALELTPLIGTAYFVIAKEEIAALTALLLGQEKGFSSSQFQEGFYYFLVHRALLALNALRPFSDLSIKMAASQSLAEEESLCMDISLNDGERTFWGRLVCPQTLHQTFRSHFQTKIPSLWEVPLVKEIELFLHLVVGKVKISSSTLDSIKVGDFVVLDQCTLDPKTQEGKVTLMLEEKPLLHAKVKGKKLTFMDYAIYQEESMGPEDDEDLFDDEDEEEEEIEETEAEEEPRLWAEGEEKKSALKTLVSAKKVPLTLTVEIDRLRLSLEELLQLTPGNVLELSARPEQGVDLTLNGKRIARAELIKLGEVLGLKILEIK